ncbi:MAG: FprA family A-type flavoprotein [Anaerolineae bacterium]|nr:FprA family A-type flavoprotein [Anaerolineae bacterium]
MPAIEVKPGIYWIGVNDRTTDLFEGLWPITSEGVSYNAYLVNGDKKVLIDMAKDIELNVLLDQIAEVVDPSKLDYIVVNHMEPDHTGVIKTMRRIAPGVQVLGTARTQRMLAEFYNFTENVQAVNDAEILDLGTHQLQFFAAPMVHWPETMVTYETTHRVLFSCDAFGGYGALQGAIFDDQCTMPSFYERESLRYYVNIVALFHKPVLKAIEKLRNLKIDVVAPSHGLIWREHPEHIIQLYEKWAGYATGKPDLGVTLVYGTMYGNTEEMVDAVAQGVVRANVPIEIFDVRHTHASYILPSIYTHSGVLVGAPTYEGALFPPMAHLMDVLERKRIQNRKVAYMGSYGWSGGARRELAGWAEKLKWEMADTFEFPGMPTAADLRYGVEFGYRFAQSLKEEA